MKNKNYAPVPEQREGNLAVAAKQSQSDSLAVPEEWCDKLLAEFPLLDDEGLCQEKHHCEWTLQQDRKRLHTLLQSAPQAPTVPDDRVSQDESTLTMAASALVLFRAGESAEYMAKAIEALLQSAPQSGSEPQKEYAWECNECGAQEYTMSVGQSIIESGALACGSCGCDEFHKAEVRND